MSDDHWPSYDRAPTGAISRLCEDGLLAPLIKVNGEASASKHSKVPVDVHFRKQELHVYCGHARIVKAQHFPNLEEVEFSCEHPGANSLLLKRWPTGESATDVAVALSSHLETVNVGTRTQGEGLLQARWARLAQSAEAREPWTMFDREAQLSFANTGARDEANARANNVLGPTFEVIRQIARLRESQWREPTEGGGRIDQLAVDGQGNLVLIEIKDAQSSDPGRLFYAPLQLLKYVHLWHWALSRLALWDQLKELIDARQHHGLSRATPSLTGGIRAAVCFGDFDGKPSDEVKRRFYEVLGVVNAHLPSGVPPIEAWKFPAGGIPARL